MPRDSLELPVAGFSSVTVHMIQAQACSLKACPPSASLFVFEYHVAGVRGGHGIMKVWNVGTPANLSMQIVKLQKLECGAASNAKMSKLW